VKKSSPLRPTVPEGDYRLQSARTHAQRGRFPEMLASRREILDTGSGNFIALLDVGALLLDFGFLSDAPNCFDQVRAHALPPKSGMFPRIFANIPPACLLNR
jgi:hypothetical protein